MNKNRQAAETIGKFLGKALKKGAQVTKNGTKLTKSAVKETKDMVITAYTALKMAMKEE